VSGGVPSFDGVDRCVSDRFGGRRRVHWLTNRRPAVPNDYIPRRDGDFDPWQNNFVAHAAAQADRHRAAHVSKRFFTHVSKRFFDGDSAPTDPSELTFLALDTRTPYTADYAGTDGNKTAHYMLRWVNTRGEKGPWSETASATIGA
jgi:hypothetical protein